MSTTGELDLDDSQKKDILSFIKDDGKGFVGIHAALDTNYKWPEYGEMIGGWFDQHPWTTFNAPIINEDPNFPAVRHFPKAFVKYDEIYQPKDWSRDKVNVLLSLDPTKLDYANNPRVHRTDHDFAVAWDKMYGKGRVFYSSLGHTEEAWSDPDIRKMYFEAIKWVLGMTEGEHGISSATANIRTMRSNPQNFECETVQRNTLSDEFSSSRLALDCNSGVCGYVTRGSAALAAPKSQSTS